MNKQDREKSILAALDKEIAQEVAELEITKGAEREEVIRRIERLTKLRKDYTKESITISKQVDLNTIFKVVAGTILTMGILSFEKEDIINTKSFNIGTRMVGL